MRRARLACLAIMACAVLPPAGAPAAKEPPRISPWSLARRVPASAGVFIELGGLKVNEAQIRRSNLWSLVQMVLGEATSPDQEPFNWRALVRRHLGMTPETAMSDLFGRRVAVAAPTWEKLADATIIVRLRKPDVLDAIVAPSRVIAKRQQGQVRIYDMLSGLHVATDSQFVAFSRDDSDDSLFKGVVDILSGGTTVPLSRDRQFVRAAAKLSKGYTGYVYVRSPDEQRGVFSQVLPSFKDGVVGLYVRGERLEFEVWATLREPRERPPLALVDVNRLERLPSTTLAVWATSADLRTAYAELLGGDVTGDAGRYVALLRTWLDTEAFERDVVTRLGPRMVLLWDRLRAGPDTPQVAALFESWDAEGAAQGLADAFGQVAAYLRPPLLDGEQRQAVIRSEHLGTEILTVPMFERSGDWGRRTATASLLLSMRPSFTALDDWVIAAATPEHVRQIIDAYAGWTPTLGSLRELKMDRWRFGEDAVVLAVGQPAMASAVAANWAGDTDSTRPADNPRAGRARPAQPAADRRKPLGIGVRQDGQPGSVIVVRVDPNKPADGKLQIGDRITGIDGQLLRLERPSADLRRKIANSADPKKMTFRLMRDGTPMDVVVEMSRHASAHRQLQLDPVPTLRQLQVLGRSLSYAAYSVAHSPPDEFHARLSLRLVPPKAISGAVSASHP